MSHLKSKGSYEVEVLLMDCSDIEKQIIYDQIFSLKKDLRASQGMEGVMLCNQTFNPFVLSNIYLWGTGKFRLSNSLPDDCKKYIQ